MTRPPCVRLCPAYPGNPRTRIEGESPPFRKGTYGLRSREAASRRMATNDLNEKRGTRWVPLQWLRPPRAELLRRDHHDLDVVLRRRQLGLDGGARRRVPRRHPAVPHCV